VEVLDVKSGTYPRLIYRFLGRSGIAELEIRSSSFISSEEQYFKVYRTALGAIHFAERLNQKQKAFSAKAE
jgi:hypothetical protein